MKEKMFNVGKIVNTHGINGEVKVIRITDFDERFEKGRQLFWANDENSETIPLVVSGHRRHKNFDLLRFEGHPSINDVEKYKNGMLKVKKEQQEPLDEGEFYYHEIIGCEVFTNTEEYLGVIREILAPGANDVWVIKRKQEKDLLIPYIEDIVKEIDIVGKKVIIEPMEGLLD
ncbi:ribosome maturation factor RimM [Sediminibacillus massiliensis]|uniref:ribosome maturation factor RimM n=1 Tax=Sediminibacillus massiliensis TaxID=1926277 RepID=UPI0009887325|nr:ribosome maturation factor RimM [Sediminibacillus massiliensis]